MSVPQASSQANTIHPEIQSQTAEDVQSQPLETIYCQPDLTQLLANSQGSDLESMANNPIETTATTASMPCGSTPIETTVHEPLDNLLTEGYVLNIQQVCM